MLDDAHKAKYIESIQKVILNTLKTNYADYWQLFAQSTCLLSDFNYALVSLVEAGGIAFDFENQLFFSTGSNESKKISSDNIVQGFVCPHCSGRGVDLQHLHAIKYQIAAILECRPPRMEQFDQALAPIDVVLARTAFMQMYNDLEGKSLLLLGDDDFLGPCLALTRKPKQVMVLEIDQRVINVGCQIKQEYNLDILTYRLYDAATPLPSDLIGEFDSFFIDPTPTFAIMQLFIARASKSLDKNGGSGYVTISHMEASLEKWQQVQRYMMEMNFSITDIVRKFNTYELQGDWLLESDWRIVKLAPFPLPKPTNYWYYSALMRVQSVGPLSNLELNNLTWSPDLYIDDELLG